MGKRLDYPEDFEDAYLEVCAIVAGTCVGIAGKRNLPERFDLTIVDEAGRATPSELLIPLVRSDKCILVGDHKQLPPVFDYEVITEAKTRKNIDPIWLQQSLFQYLFMRLDSKLKSTLTIQYRMHPHIANLIAHVFYKDEGLKPASLLSREIMDGVGGLTTLFGVLQVNWMIVGKKPTGMVVNITSGKSILFIAN